MIPPVTCQWDGEVFRPLAASHARRHYTIGEVYKLVIQDERTQASHGQYFASLDDKWQTLPEHLATEYPSRESLRHKALIRTGFSREQTFVLPTERAAIQFASALIDSDDECCTIVAASGNCVRRWRAQSQNYKSMGREMFERSKWAVLDWVDHELLGVSPQSEIARR
jgi:hypothetical protein